MNSFEITQGASANDAAAQLAPILEEHRQALKTRFLKKENSGSETAAQIAEVTDALVCVLFEEALRQQDLDSDALALMAVGGYGRKEMAPYSDVDLLFLRSSRRANEAEDRVVEYVLYALWDLGLKVGQATRTMQECLALARDDATIATTLLETRLLAGNAVVFGNLLHRFAKKGRINASAKFVKAKLDERDLRHEKQGNSRYALEPNIKEGKGGLRDLQSLDWIAKATYGTVEAEKLIELGVYSEEQAQQFDKAHEFFWLLRINLHYLLDRAEERLTFDVQQEIARRLGYQDRLGQLAVERLMQHYFNVAKSVGSLTGILIAGIEAESSESWLWRLPRYLRRSKSVDGYGLDQGRLCVADEEDFQREPVRLIEIFRVAQLHRLEIHPKTLQLITQNLSAITNAVREDPTANALFLEMLTSRKDPASNLRKMTESGVLGRFVPDFGRVVGMMQFDRYHHFTVDEHTMFAIDNLWRIEQGTIANDVPLSCELMPKISSRKQLYVAVFLHDIAKGRDGPHEVLGAEVARRLCPRFGLNEEETEFVAWLIENHLEESNCMLKRDIDDPKTIADFTGLVKSLEYLRCLHILTSADIRAVGPGVWNGWKASMMRHLYFQTEEMLSGGMITEGRNARIETAQRQLRDAAAHLPADDVEILINGAYPHYWLSHATDAHLKHFELMTQTRATGLPLAVTTEFIDKFDYLTITIYLDDHPGIFSRVAGTIAACGGTIADARAHSFRDDMALQIFNVKPTNQDSGAINALSKRITELLPDVLKRKVALVDELIKREVKPTKRLAVFETTSQVFIDNHASSRHTVIEVTGPDQPAVLYRITNAIFEQGLILHIAKVTAFGTRISDVFYVQDVTGGKILSADKQQRVRDAILNALRDDEKEAA